MTLNCHLGIDPGSRELRFQQAYFRIKKTSPYLNHRKTAIPLWADNLEALEFFCRRIPSRDRTYWTKALETGQITRDSKKLNPTDCLKAGQQLIHTLIEPAEPEISTTIKIIHEDDAILAIHKPSNLPVHPCGRYQFHTLTQIAKEAWPDLDLKPVHRLDIGTSGVLLLAKTKQAAHHLSLQFEAKTVQKTYLATVTPCPTWEQVTCLAPISKSKSIYGKRYLSDCDSLEARTDFKLLKKLPNNQALLIANPVTGRTNQIRLHLQELGLSILGDDLYGSVIPHLMRDPKISLQAYQISFKHPETEKLISVRVDY